MVSELAKIKTNDQSLSKRGGYRLQKEGYVYENMGVQKIMTRNDAMQTGKDLSWG